MTTATQDNVTKLYIATFGRAPEGAGLEYWVNSGLSLEDIAKSFFDQPETQAKYSGKTLDEFIQTVYANVLGRPGEAAGVAYWKGELESNNISRDLFIQAVINGAQGSDGVLLENRTEVGQYYAENGDDAPSAFDVIRETTADPASVQKCIAWIDDELPPGATPSTYFVLNDEKIAYDLTGTAKDDVFVIEEFKSAKIHGGEGSDTLDFSEYGEGVTVDLLSGYGPAGADGSRMQISWVENVRGTDEDDTINGNANANIIVMGGGTDTVNSYIGDDVIYAQDADNAQDSTINGGSGTDKLVVWDTVFDTTDDPDADGDYLENISDIEILNVGYEAEGVTAAATITALDDSLNKFKEIHGTDSYDKKGNATYDVITSDGDLDVTKVKLVSIERIEADGDFTIGKATLSSVKEVVGTTAGTPSVLNLVGTAGDVFDLGMPKFINIGAVTPPVDSNGNAIVATLILNQSLVDSLAASGGAGFDGDFSDVTLQVAGLGLDMAYGNVPAILPTPQEFFKAINYGTAQAVVLDASVIDADDGTLTAITGSEYNADILTVVDADGDVDMTGITITKVETLDFEEVALVALDNDNLTDVNNISGDSDGSSKTMLGDDTDHTTTPGGLDLTDTKLRDVYGLTVGFDNEEAIFTVDLGTENLNTLKSLDVDYDVTVKLAEAGTYDFSGLKETTDLTNPALLGDTIVGSTGDDIVKGSALASLNFDMGAGNDTVVGGAAYDFIEGGAGNDNLDGGAGDDEIIGGTGADSMTGGTGADVFVIQTGDTGVTPDTVDCINDFKSGEDWLAFEFVSNATTVAATQTQMFSDAGAITNAASLQDAAKAALTGFFNDLSTFGAFDDGSDYYSLVAQFEYGGVEYVTVDAYVADPDTDDDGVTDADYAGYTAGTDFIVKLAGVTTSLDSLDVTVTPFEPSAA